MPPLPLSLPETASQTAGPYVHIGLAPRAAGFEMWQREPGPDIAGEGVPGPRLAVEGLVRDGTGAPVRDVLIEVWQADPAGIHAHPGDPRHAQVLPGFRGFGRAISDFGTGLWRITTLKPGRVPFRDGRPMAPHLSLWLLARGINAGLHTRMYFADEAAANAEDPVLALVEPARRATLLAQPDGPGRYRFDIRLQGEGETVFLDI